jgi:hypothetical protein
MWMNPHPGRDDYSQKPPCVVRTLNSSIVLGYASSPRSLDSHEPPGAAIVASRVAFCLFKRCHVRCLLLPRSD